MFTRWLIAVPCVNADLFTTASVLISEVYCQHGAPRTVLTDQGPHFVSNFLKSLWARFDIDKRQSTPMHPQSNGMVERAVATVKERLHTMCTTQPSRYHSHSSPKPTYKYERQLNESKRLRMLARPIL
jgi:transposase InsO family protein